MRNVLKAATVAGLAAVVSTGIGAQTSTQASARAELVAAPTLRLPGVVDSNSPAMWDRVAGRQTFFVLTSAGSPKVASGRGLDTLARVQDVAIDPHPGGGVWMEAVVADVDGTWYGYYHNELPADQCGAPDKMIPRIGAARSRDQGRTWTPLGIVIEVPPNSLACSSPNEYFLGGVGDFSVQLDAESRDLYFFVSQYPRSRRLQGVAVARLAWADRDDPAGKITMWTGRIWLPARSILSTDGTPVWLYLAGVPIFAAAESWHDDDNVVDAFWGASVHWNTYLERYVMLLNRARDTSWKQEGIYISYAPRLDDPRLWSAPVKILNGGTWYPQVIGLEPGTGSDKVAGQWARFFVSGVSQHLIRFSQ